MLSERGTRGQKEGSAHWTQVSGERPAVMGHTHHPLSPGWQTGAALFCPSPWCPLAPRAPSFSLAWCPPWEGAAGSGGWANNAPSGPLCACTWHPGEGWGRGPSGHGGRSASGVGTVKARGENQRMKAGGEEREVGQIGVPAPHPRLSPRAPALPDPMATWMPSGTTFPGHWAQESVPRGLLRWKRSGPPGLPPALNGCETQFLWPQAEAPRWGEVNGL